MNIAILGAGAMGSLFGAMLAEAGQSVVLLDVDDVQLRAIRGAGILLTTEGIERRVTALAACRPEEAEGTADLLVLFTKSVQTRAALAAARRLVGPQTFVLTLQNGLGNVETVAEFVPLERILVGVVAWPADRLGPGHVRSRTSGEIRMAAADGQAHPFLTDVVQMLDRAGLRCRATADLEAAVWEKLAFAAAVNSTCALARCAVDQIGNVPGAEALVLQVIDEVLAVAHARGIAADPSHSKTMAARAIATHAGHQPSMLQDLLAGRPTEIDAINGAVVRNGREHGVATIRTEMLCTLVRLAEHARPPG